VAEAGRTRCDVCLRKARIRWKALHPVFCDECERPIKFAERSGRRLHKLCAQRRQARRYPHQHRLAALAYQRRHKEMGLCVLCPQKAFKAGVCRKHYRMAKEKTDRAARRQMPWRSSSVKPNKLIYMNLGYADQRRPHHRDTWCARHWEMRYA